MFPLKILSGGGTRTEWAVWEGKDPRMGSAHKFGPITRTNSIRT